MSASDLEVLKTLDFRIDVMLLILVCNPAVRLSQWGETLCVLAVKGYFSYGCHTRVCNPASWLSGVIHSPDLGSLVAYFTPVASCLQQSKINHSKLRFTI